MKKSVILIGILTSLLIPATAFAEVRVQVSNNSSSNVSINSESSGTSTVCQNGTCTTTQSTNTSTVCINGTCTTTDKDVDYQSKDGNTKVEINNDAQAVPTNAPATAVPTQPQITPTMTPSVSEVKEVADISDSIERQIKQRIKDQDSIIASFIQAELASLQTFINNLFQ